MHSIELEVTYDIVRQKEVETEEGIQIESEVVKKGVKDKWFIRDDIDIKQVRETRTKDGNKVKTRCEVYNDADKTWYTVKGSYEEVRAKVRSQRNKVGGYIKN
jgi:phage I-like protein